MKDKEFHRILNLLSPEQLKAMEEVLDKRQMTLDSFDLMRKDYARVKNNVKRIEKKLLALIEENDPDTHVCRWVEREIASIENKYPAIEKAISHYNQAMKSFYSGISSPHFLTFKPEEERTPFWGSSPLRNLKSYLSSADSRINEALNAIRITKRYFKNIASAFKGHATLKAARKERERRQWANEMKLAKEAESMREAEVNTDTIDPSLPAINQPQGNSDLIDPPPPPPTPL
jgi:hypothetical protein